jgi:hypothetical protein
MADTHIRQYREGQRHINLTQDERRDLAENLLIERAIAMFLDLDQDRTWKQIADELGVSLSELKRLTRKPEFQRKYDETTVAIGHDPRLQAVSSAMSDLLPLAYRQLRDLLTKGDVRDDVRLKAVLEVMKMNHVGENEAVDDPRELTNFLKANGVRIEGDVIVNMGLPDEYKEAFRKFNCGTDILDGEVRTPGTQAGALPPPAPNPAPAPVQTEALETSDPE